MPIYEFECPECKVVSEELVFESKYFVLCLKCKKPMKKIMSVPGPTWKFMDTKSSGEKDSV
jgi:putative FmdB family regulatory protein